MIKAPRTLVLTATATCLLASSLILNACASRHETSAPQYIRSSSITFQVKEGLLRDPEITSKLITVNTYRDTVTLSGYVHTAKQEDRAIEIARNVKGVKYVVDNLEIKPKKGAEEEV